MGKKSRSKNKRPNRRLKDAAVKPDDYFSFGPIEIARFGKFTILRSNFTSEQFSELQDKLVERFPIVCQEIDSKIAEIVEAVKKYSPVQILQRAYWEMAEKHFQITSEVDADATAANSLRMVDYLQSIIAAVPSTPGDHDEITEENWNSLKELVASLFLQLNTEFQECRTAFNRRHNTDFDLSFEEYYYKAQLYWVNIRGVRYLNEECA